MFSICCNIKKLCIFVTEYVYALNVINLIKATNTLCLGKPLIGAAFIGLIQFIRFDYKHTETCITVRCWYISYDSINKYRFNKLNRRMFLRDTDCVFLWGTNEAFI
jgi:hypothetical protein